MDNMENNNENLEIEVENDVFSTVFSDPAEHEDLQKKGKNKRALKVISLLLTVAVIIGGTFAIIKLIPEKQQDEASQSKRIKLLEYYDYDMKEVTIKNINGTFEFYSNVVEAYDETMSETLSETFWYLKGYDTDLTQSDTIVSIIDAAVNMSAIREITTKTAKDCGFDNPTAKIDAVTNEDKPLTIEIGSVSPDNAGVYVRTSLDNKIYLVGEMLNETFTFTDLDLASLSEEAPIDIDDKYKEYISNGELSTFDTITVSGKNFPKDMVFKINPNESLAGYMPFLVVEPMSRTASNVEQLYYLFNKGFTVSGAYAYDAKDSTIKKFGLDNPDFSVTIKLSDFTYTYKFKLQKDGNYAYLGNDSKNIKKVSLEDCSFLNYTTTDFYSSVVFITPIDGVSNFEIETEEGSHSFNIAIKDNGDSTNKYSIESNGKVYNSTYFSSYMSFLFAIQNMDFETEQTNDKPSLKMTFTYNDNTLKPTVIEYVKINATKYQYSIDGVAMGRIGSSSYNKIIKNLKRLLDGKQIISN